MRLNIDNGSHIRIDSDQKIIQKVPSKCLCKQNERGSCCCNSGSSRSSSLFVGGALDHRSPLAGTTKTSCQNIKAHWYSSYLVNEASTDYIWQSFFPRTVREWNSLPAIVDAPSLGSFKAQLVRGNAKWSTKTTKFLAALCTCTCTYAPVFTFGQRAGTQHPSPAWSECTVITLDMRFLGIVIAILKCEFVGLLSISTIMYT